MMLKFREFGKIYFKCNTDKAYLIKRYRNTARGPAPVVFQAVRIVKNRQLNMDHLPYY